ncbi:uncharacterized protein BT62DRAFT_1010501 [Guyanagaster necrorhizus]|uniref:Uncharacterized protein n=1 Tax=Guyanagaster necrorhizus TaxID=856835 RepID=A0A9P7VKD9_9AGAR|nr:uncharacterized protein BT62DRAFT_1010501 [Guyanagaster necrorhizus MCA 3950]KAG7442247.1 hypothetical protein BT62DRAFT_1010501 [Guyanagaster necrorhizus MCA 3950]
MISVLLYAFLFASISRGFSLNITAPTHPLANSNTSVLLTWTSDDPQYFCLVVGRRSPPDVNFTSSILSVKDFVATRNVSVVFVYTGTTLIEAIKTSTTEASVILPWKIFQQTLISRRISIGATNVTFAWSDHFHVDEGPVIGFSVTQTPVQGSATPTSTSISSSATSTDASLSSKHDYTAPIIAGAVGGACLLALIAASLFIWQYRKRRRIPPSRAFLNDLDDKRWYPNRAPPKDHPPPAYSPRINPRGHDDPITSKTPPEPGVQNKSRTVGKGFDLGTCVIKFSFDPQGKKKTEPVKALLIAPVRSIVLPD